ncbi:MAG: NADH:flavin oxidoreductase, partial [Planctomycetaceae bacterium]
MAFRRIGSLKSVEAFREHVRQLGLHLPVDDRALSAADGSPLAAPYRIGSVTVGNRWAIHPMEGWDGTADGRPSPRTTRRWQNFGISGCKLIWGGEAFAVAHEGRANPNQLCFHPDNLPAMSDLLTALLSAHRQRFGPQSTDDLLVGLQLTHSGRFSRPNRKDRAEPRIVYHHPVLDRRLGIDRKDDRLVLTDDEIARLVTSYLNSARLARDAGFQFVDIKHCHGYLGHELLSAYTRPGRYGGCLENRTRFLREVCQAIRAECPELMIGVRLSLFDMPPFHASDERAGQGEPDTYPPENYPGFGCRRDRPLELDLEEPIELLKYLRDTLNIELLNLTAGSPYYNPHIQRPALFPPSDGYNPPEDPLVGCVRQFDAVRRVKRELPELPVVGSAYSYLQDFLPHVTQALVRQGAVDFIGLGRMALSYWDLAADVMQGS